MAEILVIGTPNEDKKPQIQFLNSDGNLIDLADLVGYGVIIYNPNGGIIGKFGKNIMGFDDAKLNEIDANTFEIILEGASIPKHSGNITARTVVEFTDPDYTPGYRTDYSEERQILYTLERR